MLYGEGQGLVRRGIAMEAFVAGGAKVDDFDVFNGGRLHCGFEAGFILLTEGDEEKDPGFAEFLADIAKPLGLAPSRGWSL